MTTIYPVSVNEAAKDVSIGIRVTGLKRFTLRIWLALQVLRLASLILPTRSEIEVEVIDDAGPREAERPKA